MAASDDDEDVIGCMVVARNNGFGVPCGAGNTAGDNLIRLEMGDVSSLGRFC